MIPKPVTDPTGKVKISTPLATIGVFVAILRERFKTGEHRLSDPELSWEWLPDIKTTEIFVESGWNENLEGRSVRPGVWVDRGQNVYGKVSIGEQDQMPVYQNVRLEQFYCMGELDIMVDCTAPKRGESMILGSVVQTFLHMSSKIIAGYFGFREISPLIMGQTVPFEKDDTLWNSPVNFRVYYENRWATLPIAVTLNSLNLKIADKTDPDLYFREIAMNRTY
jgi:hypothetical protein